MKNGLLFGIMLVASCAVSGLVAYEMAKKGTDNNVNVTQRERVVYDAPDLSEAAEKAVEGVVSIEAIQVVQGYTNPIYRLFGFGDTYQYESRAGGSGVIISEEGYVVTNSHVVEGARKIAVKLYDERTFAATLIGTDKMADVALLKIDTLGTEQLPVLDIADSDELRLGEWVLAIGSPFDLQSTITAGIVSAKARTLETRSRRGEVSIASFIQTDAVVNPGNSGGALVNAAGELVGINTMIKSQTGTYIGYSFAVPSNAVQEVVERLKRESETK